MGPLEKQRTISFLYKHFCYIYKNAPKNKTVDLLNGTSFKKIVYPQPDGKSDPVKTLSITHKGLTFILKDYMDSNLFTASMAGEQLIKCQYVGSLFEKSPQFINEDWPIPLNTLEDSIPVIHSSFG